VPYSDLIPSDAPRFVKGPQLARWLGVTRRCILLWVMRGILPEPIRLGPKTIWYQTEFVRAALDALGTKAARKPRRRSRA
jgi:predicted DNA-binding transcriptional regulator AlpA